MEEQRVKIAGFGGQGIILMAYILGKAVSIYDGKFSAMTEAYGPESRGGACSSQLVISGTEVNYPLVDKADVLIALSQEGYDTFKGIVDEGGTVFYETDLVKNVRHHAKTKVFDIPCTRLAEEMGKKIVANIVMLGFITAKAKIASKEAMLRAIKESVPEKFIALNVSAFEKGYAHALERTAGKKPKGVVK